MDQYNTCPQCQGNLFMDWNRSEGEWYEFCLQCRTLSYLPMIAHAGEMDFSQTSLSKYLRAQRNELPVGM